MVLMSLSTQAGQKPDIPPPTTVDSVDLQRYMGLWYEIARIPNRFQDKCAGNVKAFYELRSDGRVNVTNYCQNRKGKESKANGLARVVDTKTNAKLQVSFFRPLGIDLFWGDYWIIALDPDYQWAIVGHPERKYGWILARDPQINPEDLSKIHSLLREKGYFHEDFLATEQPIMAPLPNQP